MRNIKRPRAVTIKSFVEDLAGWSNPFVGIDESGEKFLVKAVRVRPQQNDPGGRQRKRALVAEFLMSKMAAKLGLNWPNANLATICPEVRQRLDILEPQALAFDFLTLRELCKDRDLKAVLGYYLQQGENREQLAGYAVFVSWAHFWDVKPDVLQLDHNDRFIFIDGGNFLGVDSRNGFLKLDGPEDRARFAIDCELFVPLRGSPIDLFAPWFDKVFRLQSTFDCALGSVPSDWLEGEDWKDRLSTLFDRDTNRQFREFFENEVSFYDRKHMPWLANLTEA